MRLETAAAQAKSGRSGTSRSEIRLYGKPLPTFLLYPGARWPTQSPSHRLFRSAALRLRRNKRSHPMSQKAAFPRGQLSNETWEPDVTTGALVSHRHLRILSVMKCIGAGVFGAEGLLHRLVPGSANRAGAHIRPGKHRGNAHVPLLLSPQHRTAA
jgi:hypothetical protein